MKRSTVLALILLALVAGLYWYTRQEGNFIRAMWSGEPSPTPNMPNYLVEPYARSVNSIAIRQPDGAQTILASQNGAWALTQETAFEASQVDQSAADSLAMSIQTLRILSQIEAPVNLADFGLESERAIQIQVTFNDNSNLSLRVGKATPTGSGYYALDESNPDVVLILAKMSLDSLLALPSDPPLLDSLESTPAP